MRILFDTSVLVASMVEAHPKHTLALSWLQQAVTGKIEAMVAAHSLAECYSVLTTLPVSPKISPSMAQHLIHENIEKLARIITLSASDYMLLIKKLSLLGLSGGIVYDEILLKAAEKSQAKKLLTFNKRDFIKLAQEKNEYIISP